MSIIHNFSFDLKGLNHRSSNPCFWKLIVVSMIQRFLRLDFKVFSIAIHITC